jgi:hypothetical protein
MHLIWFGENMSGGKENMPSKYILFFTVPVILLAALITPRTVLATSVELNVPGDYPSIQSALNDAEILLAANPGNTYSILVEPSSTHYTVPTGGLVLKSSIPVRGRETARTIINGGGGTYAVTATGVTGVSFKNFTIMNASNGILVTGNSAVTISNNVFVGMTNIAVIIQNSTASSVTNNTFYQNGAGVSRDTDLGAAITNNIFYNSANTTQIIQNAAETTITYNLFFPDVNGPKGTFYIPSLTITDSDPLFVDSAQNDFHIKSSPTATSPCINNGSTAITDLSIDGTTSDIGAYGGPYADTIPSPVSGVTASLASADSISVSWSANTSYVVNDINPNDHTTTGGYNLYYSLNQSHDDTGLPYQNKLTLASTVTGTVISGLTTTSAPPAAPVMNPPGFDNQTLKLSWSAVPNATGYYVYYLVTGTTNTQKTDIIHATSYDLGGLINLTDYTVWVTAYAQPAYYFAVTAFDYTSGAHTPGIAHESAYSSPETVFNIGSSSESSFSNTVTGFPEAIEYNPNLPNKGCFIATAAYGYYDAPQVQALRDLRDRYLETNSAGRAFVRWYYEYGPLGAAALNAHPWLKPVVRTALMPAVGGALFLTRTSTFTQLLVLFLFSLMTAVLVIYKKGVRRGGSR